MKEELNKVILFVLDQTNKKVKQFSQRELDRNGFGITVDQWVLLKVIEESPGLSQRDLAEKSIKDPASITRMLDLLERKAFILREPIPGNRRQYKIQLSDTGQQFINDHMEAVQMQRARSLQGFSSNEIKQLESMLLRIQANMS